MKFRTVEILDRVIGTAKEGTTEQGGVIYVSLSDLCKAIDIDLTPPNQHSLNSTLLYRIKSMLLPTTRAEPAIGRAIPVDHVKMWLKNRDRDVLTSPDHEMIQILINQLVPMITSLWSKPAVEPEGEQEYYICVKDGFVGAFATWWRADGAGYTRDINKAGLFTKEHEDGGNNIAYHKSEVDSLVSKLVLTQDLSNT